MKINAYKMGTVTVSIYGNNGTLDTDTCLNKYAEILAYIKEEVNNVHENSEKCRKVHEYINEKSALLNECNIRKHLSLDLNDSNEIKSFKEKCNKHLEDISKPALQEQQDTKFKLEEEKSPGQSEESGQKSKTAKVKGGASQKESNEAPPTISISEGQQSGDDGKEYAEVDGSIRGQVSPQDQHDTTLHSSADEAQEVKTLAQLSQQSGKYEHQQKEMELIFASDNEGETESNDCQNKPSSSCSLEGKSDEAGTPQAKGLKEASKQGDTQDENAVVLSTLQNPYSEGNMTQHSDHEIILTELCSDTTHSGITSSAEVGASKAPNNVTSHSVDSGKIQHFSYTISYHISYLLVHKLAPSTLDVHSHFTTSLNVLPSPQKFITLISHTYE
ncbi:variable surface protein [Plasmodium gonderi]|uniref:Variable surface protein n=1 Tax=Plasmodium gonderi TaxID=77519 RepID=A0A1Y1JDW6_PLAGO|nr:variable surface protein [Plasmodium gonderi]GAW79407.1 variable surface protein [Plasmodium gonderi]